MSSHLKSTRPRRAIVAGLLERWHWALLVICLCFGSYLGLRASTDTGRAVQPGPVASATAPAQPQTKNIEEIEVGDVVMARDDVTGEVAPKRVAQVFRNTSDHLRILTIRNADGVTQEIQTTNEHPFYVPESGWTSAGELTPGTKLLQMDEQLGVVVATRFEEHPEGVPVFNFEVEDYHTYYVADQPARGPPSGLLAHNMCARAPKRAIVLGETMSTRVNPVATKIGAHTFAPRSVNPARWMANQKRWIRDQIKSGRPIYDIGTHATRPRRSAYYAAERAALEKAGYAREFRRWISVDVGGTMKRFRLYEWVKP